MEHYIIWSATTLSITHSNDRCSNSAIDQCEVPTGVIVAQYFDRESQRSGRELPSDYCGVTSPPTNSLHPSHHLHRLATPPTMSFFGFETTLPRDQRGSRGVFEQHDPFAGLGDAAEADDALDFEQTYDGLGNQLNETGDTFNDDTFGSGMPATRQSGRDFDFAGQTANIRDTLMEEQTLHHARMPMQQAMQQKPKRTGYEAYKQPDYLPKLEADASIWGASVAKKPSQQAQAQAQQQQYQQQQQYHQQQQHESSMAAARKMMTLEEVEAMMRSQAQPQATPPVNDMESQSQGLRTMLGVSGPPPGLSPQPQQQQQRGPPGFQRPPPQGPSPGPQGLEYNLQAPQILQRQHSPQPPRQQQQQQDFRDFQGPPQQMQFQQPPQPQGPMGAPPVQAARGARAPPAHARDPSYSGPPITQAQQMMQMSSQDREVYLAEEAKRAKRNHKIFLLSKNNGLMTPQDKNFITRIQLQQLLTATGGIDNEPGSEDQLAEDFYYQVYAQIRGPPRSGPGQPLNQFAQTYLFQTGSRYGYGRSRHHPRGGDNHVQRMEQQVARAVEAAKARPKNKSLVMEGSLGKIAFSNSKTPRPLLNIKRVENDAKPRKTVTVADRKATLRSIEKVYSTLMQTEDHERRLPPPPNEESPPDVIEGHMRWRSEMAELNQQLWAALKVMEPINPK
jgi:DNA topoisomerase 2-associated protein PAT1